VAGDVRAAAERHRDEHVGAGLSLPAALVPCSAVTGYGVPELGIALQRVLRGDRMRPLEYISPAPVAAMAAAAAPRAAAADEDAAAAADCNWQEEEEEEEWEEGEWEEADDGEELLAGGAAAEVAAKEPVEPLTEEDMALINMSEEELLALIQD
jgi:hypothetical protein